MFEAVLSKDSDDAHACLHLGFVLKAGNNQGPDLERGVELLSKGIQGMQLQVVVVVVDDVDDGGEGGVVVVVGVGVVGVVVVVVVVVGR